VGREEEGSSSNRPELAAFLLAFRDTLIEEPLLYLCDNRSLWKAVNRWIVESRKATLVRAPDADILATAIEILQKRIAAGTAAFLVKAAIAIIFRLLCLNKTCGSFNYFPKNTLPSFCRNMKSAVHVPYTR